MVYLRNQPIPTDDLSISAPILATNTNAADDSFGVDHYKFSDLTVNNGFHNTVTTPVIVGVAHPTTTAVLDKFYAMQDSPLLGILQYSRGWNATVAAPAVPTPVTSLHSPSTPIVMLNGGTTNILDFTGISRAFVTAIVADLTSGNTTTLSNTTNVFWTGSAFTIMPQAFPLAIANQVYSLKVQSSGNILQAVNNSGSTLNNVYWTLKLHRLS